MSVIINNEEYKIIKELGLGGFGKVYKLQKDNSFYAYKKILIDNSLEENLDDYNNEAKILSNFNNEYIVKYFYSFQEKEYFNILMEYAGDFNLKQFILNHKKKNQLIEENIIKNIIIQICLGLKEIHKLNLIHRDLTPENIFINENNKIKIGDFGVSKQLNTNNKYAKTDTGKEHYKAPEIIKGEKYDNRVDIYSLGCIIYELFTLNEYYIDKYFYEKDGKINIEIYNPKWQNLIDTLLKKNYYERPFIEEVYNKLEEINGDSNFEIYDDNNKENSYKINYIPENKISNNEDFINFKLIMIGDSKYKHSIAIRARIDFIGFNEEDYTSPIGSEFISLYFKINELKIRIQIWDTCGQEIYHSITRSFYRDTSLAIIVYDVESKKSFENLDEWIKVLKKETILDIPFFIVGNINNESKRVVSIEEAKKYSDFYEAKYFTECSCKSGYKIKDIFLEAAKCLYESYKKNEKNKYQNMDNQSFRLESTERIKIQKAKKVFMC